MEEIAQNHTLHIKRVERYKYLDPCFMKKVGNDEEIKESRKEIYMRKAEFFKYLEMLSQYCT